MDTEKTAFFKQKRNLVVQTKTVLGLGLVQIIDYATISCLAPFFSKEAEYKGVSMSVSGIVFVASPIVLVVISPFLGTMVSQLGTRKLFLFGMAITGCSNILLGFLNQIESSIIFVAFCILCRGFSGLGAVALGTNVIFLAEAFPNEINRAVGINEIFPGIGVCIGPILGGLLYDLGGFSFPFWVLGALLLCLIPVSAYCLPHVTDPVEDRSSNIRNMLQFLKSPVIVLNLLATVTFSCGWSFIDPILEPELRKEFGLTSTDIASIFFIMAISYTISSIVLGGIADRINRVWILTLIGFIGCAISILILDPSLYFNFKSNLWFKVSSLCLLGVFIALGLVPTYGAMVKDATKNGFSDDSATYGSISGLWNSFYALGDVIGPSLGAYITEHYEFKTTCSVTSTAFLILAVVYYLYFSCKRKHHSTYCDIDAMNYENIDVEYEDETLNVESADDIVKFSSP